MVKGEQQLWSMALRVAGAVTRYLIEVEKRPEVARFRFSRLDQLRLLRLQVWSWQYQVSVEEILTLLLPRLRKAQHKPTRRNSALGVTVAVLVSRTSRNILLDALYWTYPGKEHVDIWRDAERERQLEAERVEDAGGLATVAPASRTMLDFATVDDYLSSYRKRVFGKRRALDSALGDSKRRRKRYRGNPWF